MLTRIKTIEIPFHIWKGCNILILDFLCFLLISLNCRTMIFEQTRTFDQNKSNNWFGHNASKKGVPKRFSSHQMYIVTQIEAFISLGTTVAGPPWKFAMVCALQIRCFEQTALINSVHSIKFIRAFSKAHKLTTRITNSKHPNNGYVKILPRNC